MKFVFAAILGLVAGSKATESFRLSKPEKHDSKGKIRRLASSVKITWERTTSSSGNYGKVYMPNVRNIADNMIMSALRAAKLLRCAAPENKRQYELNQESLLRTDFNVVVYTCAHGYASPPGVIPVSHKCGPGRVSYGNYYPAPYGLSGCYQTCSQARDCASSVFQYCSNNKLCRTNHRNIWLVTGGTIVAFIALCVIVAVAVHR